VGELNGITLENFGQFLNELKIHLHANEAFHAYVFNKYKHPQTELYISFIDNRQNCEDPPYWIE
jgi:hypothetical protein